MCISWKVHAEDCGHKDECASEPCPKATVARMMRQDLRDDPSTPFTRIDRQRMKARSGRHCINYEERFKTIANISCPACINRITGNISSIDRTSQDPQILEYAQAFDEYQSSLERESHINFETEEDMRADEIDMEIKSYGRSVYEHKWGKIDDDEWEGMGTFRQRGQA